MWSFLDYLWEMKWLFCDMMCLFCEQIKKFSHIIKQMLVWIYSPKAVFMYENPRSLNVFCILATRRCANTVREMLILPFINLYVLFNAKDTVVLCSIFYRDTRVPVFTTWKEEMEDSAGQEHFYIVAKAIKSALELLLFSSSNSNKDV